MKEINEIMKELLNNILRRCPFPTGEYSKVNHGIAVSDGFVTMTCIPAGKAFLVIAQNQKDNFTIYVENIERAEDLIVEAFNTSDASARFIQRMDYK